MTDGRIEYLGRNDFQVKIRGFRIELGEIENRLCACAGVNEAVVVARSDVHGNKRLLAYLTSEPNVELSPSELHRLLAVHLPDYMLPSAFVILSSFPLNANGKLDRAALPLPDTEALLSRQYQAPQGEIEITLARIWQDLLDVERVGRHDQFFELGGHSLLALTLVERLHQSGWILPAREVFAHPVLSDLAAIIDKSQEEKIIFEVPPNLISNQINISSTNAVLQEFRL